MKVRTWESWRKFWGVDVSIGDDGTWAEVVGGEGGESDRPRILVSGAVDLRPAVVYRRIDGRWRMLTLGKADDK
jgi:hypothetical protein